MSKATYSLKLPASIKAAAARFAKEDGVSLNQWIATAEDLKRIMDKVPDVPAAPEDALPPIWLADCHAKGESRLPVA